MVLKGLPTQYNTFKTVVTQREREMSFTEIKVALRSFEETEKCQQPSASGVTDRVMTAQPTQRTRSNSSVGRATPTNPSVITCYTCEKIGHKSYDCRSGKTTKRYLQIPNVDYHETFSPTARITSVRMLMQLAVQDNLVVHQMDVKTAYLFSPIDCEIYIEQPDGFEQQDKNGVKLVCKLQKSLYGLKHSGRNWNNMLHQYLQDEQFEQSLVDPCVYTRIKDESKVTIIVWVDDIIVAANNTQSLVEMKRSLSQRFKMKDLGPLSWYLGIQFKCGDDCIEMNQSKYVENILNRFGMTDCKPKPTPCEIDANKIRYADSTELSDSRLYREIVGSLRHDMHKTRFMLHCVNVSAYGKADTCSPRHGKTCSAIRSGYNALWFEVSEMLEVNGFCDSDCGASEDRRSITGYGFQLCSNGP